MIRLIRSRLREPRLTDPPNPIVTCLLIFASANGWAALVGKSNPASVRETLSPALQVTWALCLAIGGLLALAGQWWLGTPFKGAKVKQAGLSASAGGCLAYATALLLANGWGAAAAAALPNFGFGVAFLLRAVQVHFLIRAAVARAQAHDRALAAARAAGEGTR